MNEHNYTQRNKKSKKAQETEQSCTISKESFFIALYCEAGFSAAEKGTTQSVLVIFWALSSIHFHDLNRSLCRTYGDH